MTTRLTLPVSGLLDVGHLLQVLQVHSLPNQEVLQPERGTLKRVLRLGDGTWLTELALHPTRVEVDTEAPPELVPGLVRVVNHWLGLAEPGAPSLQRLAADRLLGPLARRHPRLRLIGYPDFFEALATTVLGQQVSTQAARTLATRYTQALGIAHGSGLRAFPDANATAVIDAPDLARIIGCPISRARTLQAVAAWHLTRDPALSREPDRLRESLLQVKGIGPWSAEYVLLRGLRDARVFLGSDLVVRRSLERLGFTGRSAQLDWGADNAMATVLLWYDAATARHRPPHGSPREPGGASRN